MFVKKGPLSKVWIAAHFHRKLNKNHVLGTDIDVSAKNILDPTAPLALRLSGQLLLGLVRIYQRKVKYLQEDCSDALTKMKMLFRPGNVDLNEENETAHLAAITHPDTLNDVDNFIPDIAPDELENILDPNMHSNSESDLTAPSLYSFDAAASDITLKDAINLDGVDLLDDFNENLVLGPLVDGQDDSKVSEVELPRDFEDIDDFNIDPAGDSQVLRPNDKSSDYSQMGQDFSGLDASTTDAENLLSAPEEHKAAAKPKPARKRKLEIVDKRTELSGKQISAQLKDTSDIVCQRELIPLIVKRSKLRHERINVSLQSLLTQPSTISASFLGSDLLAAFARNAEIAQLDSEPQEKKSTSKKRKAEDLEQNQEFDLNNSGENLFDEFDDLADVNSSIAITPVKDPNEEEEEKHSQSHQSLDLSSRDRDGDLNEYFGENAKTRDKIEKEGEEELFGWSQRTKKMHQILTTEMRNKKSVQFDKIVDGKARNVAAGIFYQMLVLKTHSVISVDQKKPFEDFTISKDKNFANPRGR